jgi:glucokinase
MLKELRCPTPNSKQRLVETIARAIAELKDGYEVGGVCLAVPGLILAQEDMVVFSPNLRTIEGILLKKELEPRIGLPLTVENDNSAAAWGEFRFGAGGEVDHLVFVGLGTGIGGGVISHGVLLRGAQGAGGEQRGRGHR